MVGFDEAVLAQAAKQREVGLTTFGRMTGKEHRKVIWASTDGRRIFIRSGQGLTRDWPKNLLAGGIGFPRRMRPRATSPRASFPALRARGGLAALAATSPTRFSA